VFAGIKACLQRLGAWRGRRRHQDGSGGSVMSSDGRINFTDEQRQIIRLSAGRHLVLAPPGTGKTELLAQRMLLAVANGVDPRRMICLTFTIRAARNMEERVERRLQGSLPYIIGNVHHFCAKLLFERQLVPRSWTIIDEPMQREFMEDVLADLSEDDRLRLMGSKDEMPVGELLRICNALRQRELRLPVELADELPDSRMLLNNRPLIERIHRAYRRHKEAFTVLDFDDLLNYTYVFLTQRKDLREEDKFIWVQVDEVQDLSPLQLAIIAAIEAPGAHCVYLGDMEQAIFSFMGASLDYLGSLAGTCRIHNIQKNFRSPAYLLNVFVKYAMANLKPQWHDLPLPVLESQPAPDDLLMLSVDGAPEDEMQALADFLLDPQQTARRHRQTAILVRDNKTADQCAVCFEEHDMPVFKISGYDVMDTVLLRDTKAYLAALQGRNDRLAWARLLVRFGQIRTQRAARALVLELHQLGVRVRDLLEPDHVLQTVAGAFVATVGRGRVVVFDTETTGLDTATSDIIQIAAVEYCEGVPGRTFMRLLQTGQDLGESAAVHHITPEDLRTRGVAPAVGLREFLDFAAGAALAAHNLRFDRAVLTANLARQGLALPWDETPQIDTLDMARRLHPDLKSYRLADLIETLGLEGRNTHDALDDAQATGTLMLHLCETARQVLPRQQEVLRAQARVFNRFAENFGTLWREVHADATRPTTYRREITRFAAHVRRYLPEDDDDYESLPPGLEKFLRYTDRVFGERPLYDLLNDTLAQVERLREADLILGDERYVISTIHKAKGLEFDCVVIPRCIDDVYPHYFSKRDKNATRAMAEDARLLYVAMTRARRQLVISWPTRRFPNVDSRGDTRTGLPLPDKASCRPSPFLEPILSCFRVVAK
jgi:DNA helicase-2/ATP-dependent DNA helicase PcrA